MSFVSQIFRRELTSLPLKSPLEFIKFGIEWYSFVLFGCMLFPRSLTLPSIGRESSLGQYNTITHLLSAWISGVCLCQTSIDGVFRAIFGLSQIKLDVDVNSSHIFKWMPVVLVIIEYHGLNCAKMMDLAPNPQSDKTFLCTAGATTRPKTKSLQSFSVLRMKCFGWLSDAAYFWYGKARTGSATCYYPFSSKLSKSHHIKHRQ